MMSVAEFLAEFVKKYGWMPVGHIFCDNGLNINPFTTDVCISPSVGMVFAVGRYDSTDTANLEKYTLIAEPRHTGMHKTITCVGYDHVQHFDVNLFNNEIAWTSVSDQWPIPQFPTPAEIEAIELDPETGLSAEHTVAQRLDQQQLAVYDLYPDLDILNTAGIRIKAYQDYIAGQKRFAEAVNKLMGLSDCF